MFTRLFRRETRAASRLRRITAALVAVTGGLLAWAAAVPAASAMILPLPGDGANESALVVPPPPVVRVIPAGGMAGWQIAVIALAAALIGATAAVFLDRARGRRRVASTTG